jgi:hypothetical protein
MGLISKVNKVKRVFLAPSFYRHLFPNLKQIRKLDRPPIVLCGCPRSGTSLLMSLLDSHPDIHVIPFETAVFQLRRKEKRLFRNDVLHFYFTKVQLWIYLLSTRIKSTARMWCEKTPFNIFNIEQIEGMYPGARFINIIRVGRDVVASFHPRFGYVVAPSIWKKCILEGEKFKHKQNFLTISYERLVTQPETVMAQVKSFLALETEFVIQDWLSKTTVKGFIKSPVNNNLGTSIITENVNANSIGNWSKSASPYVKEFLADNECMSLNKKLGYN